MLILPLRTKAKKPTTPTPKSSTSLPAAISAKLKLQYIANTPQMWRFCYGGTSGIVLEPPLATIKALYNAEKLPDFTIPPEPKIPETKKEAQQGQKMQYLF